MVDLGDVFWEGFGGVLVGKIVVVDDDGGDVDGWKFGDVNLCFCVIGSDGLCYCGDSV